MHIVAEQACADFSNLRITPVGLPAPNAESTFYAKVIGHISEQPAIFQAHATSISGDLSAWLRQACTKITGNKT